MTPSRPVREMQEGYDCGLREIAPRRLRVHAVAAVGGLLVLTVFRPFVGAQRTEETRAGVVQIQQLLRGPGVIDPETIRSSCGTRVETRSLGTTITWRASCAPEPGADALDLDCREMLRAEMAPSEGLEVALGCGDDYLLFADANGHILADLGTAYMLWSVAAVSVTRGEAMFLQPWVRFGGDGGYDLLLAWDPAVSMFRIVFFAYRAGGFALRVASPGVEAEIENCEGVWRWSAPVYRFVMYRRNRNARRACDDGL